jgi:hypothetical protein
MSEYLTSLITRAQAPELTIRPRLSSMFDPPILVPGWEMPARASDENTEAAGVDGPAARRPSTAPARDQRSQSQAEVYAAEADRADIDQSAVIPRRAAATSAVRAANNVVISGDKPNPVLPREVDAQGEARASAERPISGQRNPVQIGKNEILQLPDQSNDKPRDMAVEFRAALGRFDGVAPDKVPTASHRADAENPVGQNSPTRSLQTTTPKASFPRQQPDAEPIKPELPRPIRQTGISLRSEAAEQDAPAIGQLPVLAIKARFGDGKPSASEAAHITIGKLSRREGERHDQPVSRASPSTIQVTIGRIEVRATTVAEPRQKTRPSSGASSLEDYLRHRSGRSGS